MDTSVFKDQLVSFIDIETSEQSKKILDIGAIHSNGATFHQNNIDELLSFLGNSKYIIGHNIFMHDYKFLAEHFNKIPIHAHQIIDTLYLSPLLFPTQPYHKLVKDDKLQTEDLNNPLNDAIKAKDLFYDEVAAFHQLPKLLQQLYINLLAKAPVFVGFFSLLQLPVTAVDSQSMIQVLFEDEVCAHAEITRYIEDEPIAVAYAVALLYAMTSHKKVKSITPPWVLKHYPSVENIITLLRNKPCVTGCTYCNKALDPVIGLKTYFGYDAYRSYGNIPLQEQAVKAALHHESILAVFPTGGGKSITFQVPALMSGQNTSGLTVVISPLQSLMKDQVDNLERIGITTAVTINGLLDPIERAKSIERVADGSASLLYLSPESLRSRTIQQLILNRKITRFVIDEAHCFSSWGQDFRVDYLYIGDFIRQIQEQKNLSSPIPISCFTATAKPKVIADIMSYFEEKLGINLVPFTTKTSRTNLSYRVFEKENEDDKYLTIRDLIIEKNCPTIIYVSRTKKAVQLADRLHKDGFDAKAYHGKMDAQDKTRHQNEFIAGDIQIMVATSAFGMGVDKKDVGLVIHFDISDSLENYVQEAGRAGRDENITAECYVLFNEEDLSKHFILLNQTKLSLKEIQQVWKAIKDLAKYKSQHISNSALEIARKAGWDDSVKDIETRVVTAIAALEDAGYIERGQNSPRIFANSILYKNAHDAVEKILASSRFTAVQKEQAIRIIKKLFSTKYSKSNQDEVPESRVDYISDHLGIVKAEVIEIITLLRQEQILADNKDLTVFIKKTDSFNKSLSILEKYADLEKHMVKYMCQEEQIIAIKELNETCEAQGIAYANPVKIKTIFNFWSIKNWISKRNLYKKDHIGIIANIPHETFVENILQRHELASFILTYLFDKLRQDKPLSLDLTDEILIDFSILELKMAYEKGDGLFQRTTSIYAIEDALFYLSRIDAVKIDGGFLVVYNKLNIKRLEHNNFKKYTKDDYQKLQQFYENKIQQIHIVGEYAKKMIADYKQALQFVEDYFHLNYSSFLNKYFPGSKQNEIKRNITPRKFHQLFGTLSPTQLGIINDRTAKHIVVAAGPGSGKTRVLVHKIASLLLMDDVKHEQLLMLTFSRAAATEFKKRLIALIGNAAHFVEIKTFHSYCFDLLGRIGNIEKSTNVLEVTIDKIKNNDVEPSKITKSVLVIDEAQDMDMVEMRLVELLIEKNEDLHVIVVGDDDQNIYEFRGASSEHFKSFMTKYHATKHELVENYRSKHNLVAYSNTFASYISQRLKSAPIIANQMDNGIIQIHEYYHPNLIQPLVEDLIRTELIGTTCVLTKTNDEALQITGLLIHYGFKAQLIQSNEGFNLYNLDEVRYFVDQLQLTDTDFTIDDDRWLNAKRRFYQKYKNSAQVHICINIVKQFEAINTRVKYVSDFKLFIKESKMEDFYDEKGETIFVSTIHKAKGKEFDNVFLLLEQTAMNEDATKRLLYVALTRAKQRLHIHYQGAYLRNISVAGLAYHVSNTINEAPKTLVMHTYLKDVWLSYFTDKQFAINELISGDELYTNGTACVNQKGQVILKFSKQFTQRIQAIAARGYTLQHAKVNYIVYWKSELQEQEIKIVLPELYFIKQ